MFAKAGWTVIVATGLVALGCAGGPKVGGQPLCSIDGTPSWNAAACSLAAEKERAAEKALAEQRERAAEALAEQRAREQREQRQADEIDALRHETEKAREKAREREEWEGSQRRDLNNERKPASAAAAGQLYYRVRRGDSLARIARHHGTSPRVIAALNGFRARHRIYVGQILRLPNKINDNLAGPQPEYDNLAGPRPELQCNLNGTVIGERGSVCSSDYNIRSAMRTGDNSYCNRVGPRRTLCEKCLSWSLECGDWATIQLGD